MKAMILAAGRGERLKPITDTLPKALVPIHNKPLIVYHVENLAKAGFKEIVINLAYLGEKIQQVLGNGHSFGLNIAYSFEGEDPLETGGGIFNALHLLENQPFITINADIYTDFSFSDLKDNAVNHLSPENIAHLVLIPNRKHHAQGDFSLQEKVPGFSLLSNELPRPYTASGITLYHQDFFKGLSFGKFSVGPLWRKYADERKISASVFHGRWHDIGTLEKLMELEAFK